MDNLIALALGWAETAEDLEEAIVGIKNIYDSIVGNVPVSEMRRLEMIMFRLLVLNNYKVEKRIGYTVDRVMYCQESEKGAEYRATVIRAFDRTFNRQQAVAYLKIGIDYMNRNEKNAFHYFMKSALEGSTIAAYQCGKMIMDGKGCEKNEFLAAFWHWQAVNMNNTNAMASLAYDYYEGRGVLPGKVRAMYWFSAGTCQLDEVCIRELAGMLTCGEILSGQEETGFGLLNAIGHLDNKETAEYVRQVGAMVNNVTGNWLIENEGGI